MLECLPSGNIIGRRCLRIHQFVLYLESMKVSVRVNGRPYNGKLSSKRSLNEKVHAVTEDKDVDEANRMDRNHLTVQSKCRNDLALLFGNKEEYLKESDV